MIRSTVSLCVLIGACILSILVALTSNAFAGMGGEAGNVRETGFLEFGLDLDFVSRKAEIQGAEQDLKRNLYMMRVTFGGPRGSLYALAGTAQGSSSDPTGELEFDNGFGGGLGGAVRVYKSPKTQFSIGAQFFGFSSNEWTVTTSEGRASVTGDAVVSGLEYGLWFGGNFRLRSFIPYYGILFSGGSIDIGVPVGGLTGVTTTTIGTLDYKDPLGIFLGIKYQVTPYFDLGFEARLINESSFAGTASFVLTKELLEGPGSAK